MEHSTLGFWLWFLFIGGLIGWLAGLITIGRGFGIIGDIVVGIVGAILGGWMAGIIGIFPGGNAVAAFMLALVGAIVLVGLTRLIVRQV